jgi:hypothetical protein
MSEKMNNQTLRASVNELNKATGQVFVVNSFDLGDNNKTQYGVVKQNKDGTMDLVLHAKYTKREIYNHIRGYLVFSELSISTLMIDEKPKTKKPPKKKK